MRKRITRALFTAAAAGVTITTLGFAAAGPAGAAAGGKYFTPSGGTPIPTDANCAISTPPIPSDNCGMAGYQASGRNFRFARALITIPDFTVFAADDGNPTMYVALDNSGSASYQYTRVGIAPCPSGAAGVFIVPGSSITCPLSSSGWVAFAATADTGAPPVLTVYPISSAFMGDGVLVSVYLTPTGNSVLTTITLPNGTTYHNAFTITGPVYTKALALADWTTDLENGDTTPSPAPPEEKTRWTQFFQGRFTTQSGAQGTFNGPWMLNALEATSNGTLPPTGTLIAQPSHLWTDPNSFNGLFGDAFGVWAFPF